MQDMVSTPYVMKKTNIVRHNKCAEKLKLIFWILQFHQIYIQIEIIN